MQFASAIVRLAGSLTNTVFVASVSPAEILTLRAIHGDDAVTDIRPTEFIETRHDKEYERLAVKYDRAASMNAPGKDKETLLNRLFPGAVKRLPVKLGDIGLPELDEPEDDDQDDEPATPARKPRKKAAAKKAAEPEPAEGATDEGTADEGEAAPADGDTAAAPAE